MLTLVLTRHGLTPRSRPEQHLGQKIDAPLSDEGRAQALALADRLGPIAFERIVSSPLARARQTAEAIAAAPSGTARPSVEVDDRLLEMDYGDWEGLTYQEIEARDAERRRVWEADPAARPCPGGESGDQVATRARDFVADLLDRDHKLHDGRTPADRPILAVAHSTFNRVLVCVALGIPIREFRTRIVQSQVNLTALRWGQGARPEEAMLLLLNDVAHVRRPPETPWE